jgi:hypothetical protein
MSAAEVAFRCHRALGGLLDRWRQRYPRPYGYYLAEMGARAGRAGTIDAVRAVRRGLGVPDAEAARLMLEASCPGAIAATVREARSICEGRLRFFGRAWQYGPAWDWHRDPRGEDRWPLRHWSRIDTRKGGAKYVWEPNRHQHLIALSKAWYWTGDPDFAAELERQLRCWLRQNPPYHGVNWTSGIELAVRIVSWCWALAFAGEAPQLSEQTKSQLLTAIALQAEHISGHLSAYSSANNHLVAEAAALAIVGTLLHDLPRAQDWRRTGLHILTAELARQVHPDGVGAEQAIHYHAEVLEWYLLVASMERRLGGVAHHSWRNRLVQMAVFLERVADSCNNAPAFGDSDAAQIAPLVEAPYDYHQSLRVVAALLLDDHRMLRGDEPTDERAFWLCGSPGTPGAAPRRDEQPPLAVFPAGGWVIHRGTGRDGADHHLVFNAGALGYGSLAAHGHADALSLWLSVRGVPLLIDPGTGIYHEDDRMRRYFRSTHAHNTIVVDDLDQSVQAGPTIWHDHAWVTLRPGSLPPDVLAQARHHGYRRLRDPVTHERTVRWCEPGAYAVLDRLLGAGSHRVCQHWHALPGTVVLPEPEGASCLIAREGVRIRLRWWSGVPLDCAVFEGCEEQMHGWYSPAYGVYLPSPTLRLACSATLPLALLTIIELEPDDPIEPLSVETMVGGALSVCLRQGKRDTRFRIAPP